MLRLRHALGGLAIHCSRRAFAETGWSLAGAASEATVGVHLRTSGHTGAYNL